MQATTNWVRQDIYYKTFVSTNRVKTALRVLFTGRVNIHWTVPADKKDKRLRISGKPLD